MRIAAVMATRGNPRRAAAVIECAKSLSSGKHEIEWIVGCDHDDPAQTYAFFKRDYPQIRVSMEEPPNGIGAVWNRCAQLADTPDVIATFSDDSWPGLPDWDESICQNLPEPDRIGVVAWNDTANPGQCTVPAVTRKWFDLCGLYDERFPYWFFDTCLSELYSFIVGRHVPIPKSLLLAARKGKTKGMRELSFWWGFYSHTRHERLAKAEQVRKTLGIEIPPDVLRHVIEGWEHRDLMAAPHFEAMERSMSSADGEPSERYINAKAVAQTYMLRCPA